MNVKCIETGKVYYSQRDVELDMHISSSAVSLVINGRRPHALGYHFIRTEEPAELRMRLCGCGNWFMPKDRHQYHCCPRCAHPLVTEKKITVKLGESIDSERPFTFETNMMIVSDALKDKPLTGIAQATKRTLDSVKAQFNYLVESGVFNEYAKLYRG